MRYSVEITPVVHQLNINPRLGRYLLGLPQTSEKPELTEHHLHSAAFPSLFARFNRLNTECERFSGNYRDGGASSKSALTRL